MKYIVVSGGVVSGIGKGVIGTPQQWLLSYLLTSVSYILSSMRAYLYLSLFYGTPVKNDGFESNWD